MGMSGNGKIMAMTACMMKDWVVNTAFPNGLEIQNLYQPCFDVAVKCSNTAACVADGVKVKDCAAKKDITLVQNAMLTNLWEPKSDASHADWCEVAMCSTEAGNTLFMSVGTCLMDSKALSFKKCFDDMTKKFTMLVALVGAGAWAVGVLMFFMGWCMCCRGKNKAQQVHGDP